MKVTVTTLGDEIFNLDVNGDMELMNFKALLEFESNVPAREMVILSNGRPLHDDNRKLDDYGLKDGDVLLLQRMQGQQGATPSSNRAPAESGSGPGLPIDIDFGSIEMPGGEQPSTSSGATGGMGALPEDPASIREMLLSSPRDLALLKERNPPLAEALLSGDLEKFTTVLRKQQDERVERERQRIRMLSSDPFDPDVQSQIAEEIRLKNVESNMETAMEYAPESFGQVVMLYIDCKVNGHPVKAFVDSGAQMTIMSQACAERCNIMRLVDTRWAGIAKGVGTQKIIGRVHLCQIQIGPDFLQSSFSILEEQPMDMLLGLDMLKRHQCVINLKENELVIGTTGTTTPFLGEGELPDHARLNRTLPEPMDEDKALADALNRSAQEAGLTTPSSSSSSSGPAQPSASSSSSANTSSASSSQPPAAAAAAPTGASSSFPEASIKRLTDYGFPRQQVLDELTRSGGNVDQALAALFAKSFQVPS